MAKGSYVRFDDDDDNKIKYTYSQSHHRRNGQAEYTQPHTMHKKMIERIDLILDTHSIRNVPDKHFILEVQYLPIGYNEAVRWANKRIRPSGHNVLDYLRTS